jgi:hypothetical protein
MVQGPGDTVTPEHDTTPAGWRLGLRFLLAAVIGSVASLLARAVGTLALVLISLFGGERGSPIPEFQQIGPSFSGPAMLAAIPIMFVLFWPSELAICLGMLVVIWRAGPNQRLKLWPWLTAGAIAGGLHAAFVMVARGEALSPSWGAASLLTIGCQIVGAIVMGRVMRGKRRG